MDALRSLIPLFSLIFIREICSEKRNHDHGRLRWSTALQSGTSCYPITRLLPARELMTTYRRTTMTAYSARNEMQPRDLADYGFARARSLAFDAVKDLWKKRRAEGMKQIDLAESLNRDPGWVSRALKGPGNWTMRTFGELVAAMHGEIEIIIHPLEQPVSDQANYHAYSEYEPEPMLGRVQLGSVMSDLGHPGGQRVGRSPEMVEGIQRRRTPTTAASRPAIANSAIRGLIGQVRDREPASAAEGA